MALTPARTVCLGFLAVIVLGTLLLAMPFSLQTGTWGNPLTALFTATSAVCVTGLSVVDVGTFYSPLGQGILALLFQVGGLGYMTATTLLLILIGQKFSLRHKLTLQQSLDLQSLTGGRQLVQSIVAATLVLELTGTFLLLVPFQSRLGDWGKSFGYALFHSVSAFNNAGFSLFPDSLMGFVASPAANGVVAGLILLGGIGYQALFEAYLWLRFRWYRGDRHKFSLNFLVAVSTTAMLLVGGTFAFYFGDLAVSPAFADLQTHVKLGAAWFLAVTTRTAGFNTVDTGQLNSTSLLIAIALMFVGASPGGTGGGIKTTTARILAATTVSALAGREEVFLYRRQVPPALLLKAVGVAFGSLLVVFLCTLMLLQTEAGSGFSFLALLFEATSAFGTVGLSTGITAQLSAGGQMAIVVTMYIGRVGVLLLMSALLTPPKPSAVNYPEEPLLVG